MKNESTVISFRIDKKIKESLEIECELENQNINHILNQIIQKHLKWDKFAKEIGLVFISKSIFRNILKKLTDSEIRLLATTICRVTFRDATVYMKGDFNYKNFIEIIDIWITNSHIPFRKIETEGIIKYVIQHNLGKKYSIYLLTTFGILFSELGYVISNKQLAEDVLTFEIPKLSEVKTIIQ